MSAQKRSASVTARHLRAGRPGRHGRVRRPHGRSTTRSPSSRSRSTPTRSRGAAAPARPEFERLTTTIHLHGGGEEGLGEDVTYDPELQRAQQDAGPVLPLAGELDARLLLAPPRRRSTSSAAPTPGMPAFLDYRRWAFESAAADLALRQAGRSLADVLGREPRPITFVVSLRLGEPPSAEPVTRRLAAYPGLRFKLDSSPAWDDDAARRARRDRRRRVDRLQGRLQGHAGRRRRPIPTSTGAAPRPSPRPGSRIPT